MTELSTSRLWPVLVVVATLPIGAAGVEAFAKARVGEPIVIRIDAAASVDPESYRVVDTSAAPIDSDHASAREAARRGDLTTALAKLGVVAARSPTDPSVAAEHGALLLRAKKIDEAVAELMRAKVLAPSDWRVALSLGRAAHRAKDLERADAELRRAVELNPGSSTARIALGKLVAERGDRASSLALFEAAAASGSNDERADALVQVGVARLGGGDRTGALRAFDGAIERAPARVEVRLAIARALLATSQHDDAVRATGVLVKARDLAPDLPDVWTQIGIAREAIDDHVGAEEAYSTALRLDPAATGPRRRLLRLALQARRFPRARAQAEQLLALEPREPEHHFLAGLVAARDGRLDDARRHYGDAVNAAGGSYAEAFFNLGMLERDAGHLEDAVRAYETAIAQRPDYTTAQNNLALALADLGRTTDAQRIYEAVLQRRPDYAAGWVNLGKLHAKAKRYDDAIAAYQQALIAKPGYEKAMLDLGVAYAKAKRLDDAVRIYSDLLEKNPSYARALHNLGHAKLAQGKTAEAQAAFRRALEVDPDRTSTMKDLAVLQATDGRLLAAKRWLVEALDRAPNDAEARLLLADVQRRAGDAAACRKEATRVQAEVRGKLAAEAATAMARCGDRGDAPAALQLDVEEEAP